MEDFRIITNADLEKWDEFVYNHPAGNIYQTVSWREIIHKAFRHQPIYFVLENKNGAIEAAMPFFAVNSKAFGKRLTSLPCAQVCIPLAARPEGYAAILRHVYQYIQEKNYPYAELKTNFAIPDIETPITRPFTGYSTYTLDLSDPLEQLEQSLHKNCIRRAIKKANKLGLNLITGNSINDIKIFYDIYLKMRKAYGLIPQPFRFFSEMWKTLHQKQMIEILHAEYEGTIVSSLVLLKYKNTVTYEYGASLSNSVHLKPSPFLLWEAIRRAKESGFGVFDFGRTENENEGLSTFKKRWNAKQEILHYYYLPDVHGVSSMRQTGMAKRMMNYTIKHSPEPVCQLMGNLLYRNFV